MKHSSIPSAQLVLQHCKAKKIKNIVISPGSRNAPLTIGFTEDPYFSCFSIVDERSAGFFALGIAQQLNEPVAVVCTSGSALLNYYPAVAEAFYSGIPLVVISADRPVYKIDVGDGQTIRQDDVFHRHIGHSANLKQDVSHSVNRVQKYMPDWLGTASINEKQDEVKTYNDSELNKALNIALQVKLPVHMNVPFEEPLYDTLTNETTTALTVEVKEESPLTVENIEGFLEEWNSSQRKMVLVGVNPPNTVEQMYLDILASDPSVIVLTETTSNIHHPHFFQSIDSILAPIEKSENRDLLFEQLKPDILLTFGGLVVSKKIKAFLREHKPLHHWHIDEIKAFNTFFCLSHHFKTNVNNFFDQFIKGITPIESKYFHFWNEKKEVYKRKRNVYFEQVTFSDLKAFKFLIESIPFEYQIQLSNSSTVRYTQLFDMHSSNRIFCNRGTSGIDGSTSTAVGAAFYDKAPTVLITGDLSFFYDSNGLWNQYIRPDFRIVVINNNGGGIFRILPGKEETDNFDRYFETSHHLSCKQISKQFGFDYSIASDEKNLKQCLKDFYMPSNSPKILEVVTPRLLNDKILLGYFDFIS
ncbi:2-succinyl-5-enolpyruvyl-6-hydroxy-3-cyclohexene-1-carboxylate synthase [Flavobacteriaceae bacterium MAR_2009_75]|nr:2-succinyl-5-enolpyruvyl-6-hydroxy-3-cyclohexene-1-carboxylate synthase [Flavobacteriaceae bacterium MAR_2009_75]